MAALLRPVLRFSSRKRPVTRLPRQQDVRPGRAGRALAAADVGAGPMERALRPARLVAGPDPWLDAVLALSPDVTGRPSDDDARRASFKALAEMRLPTTRDEEWRFTDLAPLTAAALRACARPSAASAGVAAATVERLTFRESDGARLVLLDGNYIQALSDVSKLSGVFAGPATAVHQGSPEAAALAEMQAAQMASVATVSAFAVLNVAAGPPPIFVHVPAAREVTLPLHVVWLSSSANSPPVSGGRTLSVSHPRLVVSLGVGASLELVEDFVALAPAAGVAEDAAPPGSYWCNSALEATLAARASLKHVYIQTQCPGAVHLRMGRITQDKSSTYSMLEASLGAALGRHQLAVEQHGPDTRTEMRSFQFAGPAQTQDLHTSLRLEHPRGSAAQLHKCIAADATARAVFDGNVRVARLAQQTDAQQLSRSLLIAPRATVNVRPNLQIVANDVKCSHGATIADLSEAELFYLRSRGISPDAARAALVYSFGLEIVRGLIYPKLRARVEEETKNALCRSPAASARQECGSNFDQRG